MATSIQTTEQLRLTEAREKGVGWRKWGPYLAERQWGTVREDYSDSGDAWNYFTHDQARSRAYRWGEDGLAGICDDKQILCFAIALWNGRDSILKERLFGLNNSEGNHGEDVKEYYFYLDSTPTHSYMKYLYKYPQAPYPYEDLVTTNRRRTRHELEYELLDTGVFEGNRYFDVFVEYAKQTAEDLLIKITVFNRGDKPAPLHLLPTLWFRNTWSLSEGAGRPEIKKITAPSKISAMAATQSEFGNYILYADAAPELLFTENETNNQRLFGTPNGATYVKDAFDNYVVHGNKKAVNPEGFGSKAAAHYALSVPAGGSIAVRLRLVAGARVSSAPSSPFAGFDEILEARRREADEFYGSIIPSSATVDQANVLRQGLAGMLWSKQFYSFDLDRWLKEHGARPYSGRGRRIRNSEWFHMVNDDIISMPDKWEYPWYAAWDLAFHTTALSLVDVDFAKQQLDLMLQALYLHPSGQIPAYEWNFSDVNPPVHAFATLYMYQAERVQRGRGDLEFLKRAFNKLALNFTWWVNRKDREGKNVFDGGFLGLDNIGVFDRSSPLPTGGYLEQADGTAWMALFSQNMLEIAIELAAHDPAYEELAVKFCEHFLWIAAAINRTGHEGLWDEEDGFYYDVLRLPDGSAQRLKVRSMVGLLPMCATTIIEQEHRERVPRALSHLGKRLAQMPELMASIHPTGEGQRGLQDRGVLALLNPQRLKRVLSRMLDENEFLSPYGIRALSKYHAKHPYIFNVNGQEFRVDYLPAESDTGMFGGNSNWRGPIWMPVNLLIIRSLLQFYLYYGDNFKVECPTGSGKLMNLFDVGHEIANRLIKIFTRDERGKRAVYGATEKFQSDPHWRDHILFYEYFHGDNGAGIGANHQTGWTGIVARLIHLFGHLNAESYLEAGRLGGKTTRAATKTAA